MLSSPASCHFLPLRSTYSLYHPVFKHPQSMRDIRFSRWWKQNLWFSGIALGYGMDDRGSRRGLGIFLFTTASRTALGPTQSPTQWVPGALSLCVKQTGRDADHSSPLPQYVLMAWCLVKHRDNFTFTFVEWTTVTFRGWLSASHIRSVYVHSIKVK
jgi:hypothetical protein